MQPNTETLGKPGNGVATPEATTNGTGSHQLHELLAALQAVRVGDFSVRMSGARLGIEGKIADTFNEIVAANQRMAQQLERVGQTVGKEGRTKQRVRFGVTERALQSAFKNSLGATPTEIIRQQRMARIHAALQSGGAQSEQGVLDVASKWGVQNRSTLVNGYRRQFNEAPSETLKR